MSVTQHSRAGIAGSLAFDPAGVAWFLLAVVAALPCSGSALPGSPPPGPGRNTATGR